MNSALEETYNFLEHLNWLVKKYPNEKHFEVEMNVQLYLILNKAGLIPDDGIFGFKGAIFTLC